jgi:hypothetical protein
MIAVPAEMQVLVTIKLIDFHKRRGRPALVRRCLGSAPGLATLD